jgi:hypothetical protein
MRCYTEEECEAWLQNYGRELPSRGEIAPQATIWYPPNPANIDVLWLAKSMSIREPILLWITEWGIWPSSENWHLYYRIRQSYGDQRLLHEAPGHLFQNYEMDDLATFLQLAMTNGWGGHILPASPHTGSAFFSHDEYIDFYTPDQPYFLADLQKHFAHLLKPPATFHTEGARTRISQDGTELGPAAIHPDETAKS